MEIARAVSHEKFVSVENHGGINRLTFGSMWTELPSGLASARAEGEQCVGALNQEQTISEFHCLAGKGRYFAGPNDISCEAV